jgi:hypothetical protein
MKPPTDDSKGFAQKKLNQSSAEVGPMPKLSAIGDPMDPIKTDPLIVWLKHAQKQVAPKPETSPEAGELGPQSNAEVSTWVKDHFSTTKGVRKKFEQKDHAYSEGVVDRILGL